MSIRRILFNKQTYHCLTNFTLSKISHKGGYEEVGKIYYYFELTEELLMQFGKIAPDMYDEFSNLKDRSGELVTVYVRFIPESEMPSGVAGTTNVALLEQTKMRIAPNSGLGLVL